MTTAGGADARFERRDLGRVLRGERARGALGRLLVPAAPRLTLVGASLTRLDACGGLVVRAAVDAHLRSGGGHVVSVVEPSSDEAWAMLCDLLGRSRLPSRCVWAGTRPASPRGSLVLVPTTAITGEDEIQLILDEGLRRATGALGYGDRAGRALQEAAAVFLDNARVHATSSPLPPLVCATLEPQGNDLQVATLDLGADRPTSNQGAGSLRAVIESSRESSGSLHNLSRPRGGLRFSVRLASGTGRAAFRSGGSWRYSETTDLPGFMAVLEIHR